MVNEILSKELQVKPLVRGDVAAYKLLGAGKPSPNMVYDDGSPVMLSPKLWMAGESTIIDPFDTERPNKTITHAPRTRPIRDGSGLIRQEEIIEYVKFNESGFLFLKYEDMHTYYFVERCNENRDNPFRDKRVTPFFDRINSSKKATKDLDIRTEAWEAMSMVMEGTIDELKTMATSLPDGKKVNLDNPIDQIKVSLMDIAEKNPRMLILASGNKDAKRLIQLRDADKYNVLVFDEALREWYINKPSGMDKICEVPIGVDKFKELLKVTKDKDNAKLYQTIIMLMGKVYKATV